jgi:hypothetical protein
MAARDETMIQSIRRWQSNDREKGANDDVTDLRVLVPRHRNLSLGGGGLAAC